MSSPSCYRAVILRGGKPHRIAHHCLPPEQAAAFVAAYNAGGDGSEHTASLEPHPHATMLLPIGGDGGAVENAGAGLSPTPVQLAALD